jgi:hypothetical protein
MTGAEPAPETLCFYNLRRWTKSKNVVLSSRHLVLQTANGRFLRVPPVSHFFAVLYIFMSLKAGINQQKLVFKPVSFANLYLNIALYLPKYTPS